MKKSEVLKIIDEVMNNREIDSIRNAILAIRDKVIELSDDQDVTKIKLRENNELCCTGPWFDGAQYVVIDQMEKIDTGLYGAYWYE